MTPQDPLASLHPLREPAAINWWPPAPGWWVLSVVTIATLALLGYLLWRRHHRNAYRRRALRQLDELQSHHAESRDDLRYVASVNALLKSVALLAYPAGGVASQHGEPWRTFLNEDLPPAERFTADFDNAAYRKGLPTIDTQQLHRSARYWITHHRVAA
jgi:hypothetical protein